MFNALMWLLTLLLCTFSGAYFYVEKNLPDTSKLRNEYPVVVYDEKLKSTKIVFKKDRPADWYSVENVSPHVLNAIVVSEDWAFYSHSGYDIGQIKEAIIEVFKGERVRGASTITQQVAKNVFLSNERTLWRKFRELVLAMKLERDLRKNKILETYINVVEFGPEIYGISQASLYYFQAPPSQLNPKEAAFLAMLLPSPVRYGESYRKRELTSFAKGIIRSILAKMVQAKKLTDEERKRAWQKPLPFEDSFQELDNYTSETEALDETGPEDEAHTDDSNMTSTIIDDSIDSGSDDGSDSDSDSESGTGSEVESESETTQPELFDSDPDAA